MESTKDKDFADDGISDNHIQQSKLPVHKQMLNSSSQINAANHTEKDRLLANSYHNTSEHYVAIDGVSQIIQNRTKADIVSRQPQKQNIGLLSHSRLVIPSKMDITSGSASDIEPLVIVEMDDSSEEEFHHPSLQRFPKRDITRQLLQDGYDLDLQPDDNDLDLIPPKSHRNRCDCCSSQFGCGIQ